MIFVIHIGIFILIISNLRYKEIKYSAMLEGALRLNQQQQLIIVYSLMRDLRSQSLRAESEKVLT